MPSTSEGPSGLRKCSCCCSSAIPQGFQASSGKKRLNKPMTARQPFFSKTIHASGWGDHASGMRFQVPDEPHPLCGMAAVILVLCDFILLALRVLLEAIWRATAPFLVQWWHCWRRMPWQGASTIRLAACCVARCTMQCLCRCAAALDNAQSRDSAKLGRQSQDTYI